MIDEQAIAKAEEGLPININGERAWARVTHLPADPGINWQIVAVIPEAKFMADAKASQDQEIYLAGVAVALSLLVGFFPAPCRRRCWRWPTTSAGSGAVSLTPA